MKVGAARSFSGKLICKIYKHIHIVDIYFYLYIIIWYVVKQCD